MMFIFKFDCDVRIVDELMGRGKTSSAIRFINESDEDEKFLFITPYLKEVERIKTNCPTKRFKEPCFLKGRKLEGIIQKIKRVKKHLEQLIMKTHPLYSHKDDVF